MIIKVVYISATYTYTLLTFIIFRLKIILINILTFIYQLRNINFLFDFYSIFIIHFSSKLRPTKTVFIRSWIGRTEYPILNKPRIGYR